MCYQSGAGPFRFALIAVAGIALHSWTPSAAQEPLIETHEADEAIMGIAISPKGDVALATFGENVIVRRPGAHGRRTTLKVHKGDAWAVAFSPDGRWLVAGDLDGRVNVWEGKTLEPVTKITVSARGSAGLRGVLAENPNALNAVLFSPDGTLLATAGRDNVVTLLNTETWKIARVAEMKAMWIECLAWSPDGRTLASGSWDSHIRLSDPATGKLKRTLVWHQTGVALVAVRSLAFSDDGKTLFSGAQDYAIRVWDVESGQQVRRLDGHTNDIKGLVPFRDGKHLLSAGFDHTIRAWNLTTGQCVNTIRPSDWDINCMVASPDGRTVWIGDSGGNVRSWDVDTLLKPPGNGADAKADRAAQWPAAFNCSEIRSRLALICRSVARLDRNTSSTVDKPAPTSTMNDSEPSRMLTAVSLASIKNGVFGWSRPPLLAWFTFGFTPPWAGPMRFASDCRSLAWFTFDARPGQMTLSRGPLIAGFQRMRDRRKDECADHRDQQRTRRRQKPHGHGQAREPFDAIAITGDDSLDLNRLWHVSAAQVEFQQGIAQILI